VDGEMSAATNNNAIRMHYYRRMPSDCPNRTIEELYTGIHRGDVLQGNPKSKCAF